MKWIKESSNNGSIITVNDFTKRPVESYCIVPISKGIRYTVHVCKVVISTVLP